MTLDLSDYEGIVPDILWELGKYTFIQRKLGKPFLIQRTLQGWYLTLTR